MQSQLPKENEEDTIRDMPEGQDFYTLPWAMFADYNRNLWINGGYPFESKPNGTVQMKIRRKGDFIQVYSNSIKGKKYTPGNPAFVGATEMDFIPVELI